MADSSAALGSTRWGPGTLEQDSAFCSSGPGFILSHILPSSPSNIQLSLCTEAQTPAEGRDCPPPPLAISTGLRLQKDFIQVCGINKNHQGTAKSSQYVPASQISSVI